MERPASMSGPDARDSDRRLARLIAIAIACDAMPRGGALRVGEPTSGKTRGTGLVDFTFP